MVRPGTDCSGLADKACIIQGDVRNREAWSDPVPECDCVVSCLGLRSWCVGCDGGIADASSWRRRLSPPLLELLRLLLLVIVIGDHAAAGRLS